MEIVEVGPRDGLQSERAILATGDKLALINRLLDAGLRRIEVASFVNPKLVPQVADAEDVVARLPEIEGASYIGLVLNRRGLDRAMATTVDEINFVVYASEGYASHNANASVEEVMATVEEMLSDAAAAGRRTTVTISVAWGDPFDGLVPADTVVRLAGRAVAAGAGEIGLGDTIGAAVPSTVRSLLAAVGGEVDVPLRCHFHNTRNTGYANAFAALDCGVERLDTSVGGYGGSPFAPSAGGNLATEDLAHMAGAPDLAIPALIDTTAWLETRLGSPANAMLGRAGPFPPQ